MRVRGVPAAIIGLLLLGSAPLPAQGPTPVTDVAQPTPAAPAPSPELGAPAAAPQPAGSPVPTRPQPDPPADFFLESCSGCHTIGGGELTGPDLQKAAQWPAPDLHAAVKRMEKNVGPMTDERIDGLVDFLKSPNVQKRLDAAKERRKVELTSSMAPGSPTIGRQLFFGGLSFSGGAIACVACHAVKGDGGNMAVDLTAVYPRMGEQSLMSTIGQPSFPLMKAAYGPRPITSQEALHLAAFFKQAGAGLPKDTRVPAGNVGVMHGAAAGLVAVVFGGVLAIFRSRRAGVRARMVRDSFKR